MYVLCCCCSSVTSLISTQVYYHNSSTNESSYTRPVPSFANMPQTPTAAKKKKEKPLVKTPIPNSDWIRVKTTEGNVFYNNKSTKQSVWTIPEEIAVAVEAIEQEETEARKREEEERLEAEQKRAEEERAMEIERIKTEVQDMVGKRKADATVEEAVSKKARVEDVPEDSDSEESDMEDWQREAAAQLAKEAEEEKERQEEERKREEEAERKAMEEEKARQRQVNVPNRVDLSLDEAKALFKVCYSFVCARFWLTTRHRHFSEKKTSTHYTLGTPLFLSLSTTPVMCCCHRWQHVEKRSMNTAKTVPESYGRRL
jgi:transcription elongation regulator 1